ncbi:MAG: phosphotransferase enzyme family protein [Syntrophobacteraceae bacterium]
MDHVVAVAAHFESQGKVKGIRKFGSGNVNDTFLVTVDSSHSRHFILQRINTHVFRHPELLMQNMRTVTEFILESIEHVLRTENRRWEVPRILPAQDGRDYLIDSEGSFWRAMSFIDSSQSYDTIIDIDHAKEVGYALGFFHRLINHLPTERLADTLAGFHVTPLYIAHYDEVLFKNAPKKSPEVDYALAFIDKRRSRAKIIEDARSQGKLVCRPIHGDPKVNNIMIDSSTGRAVSIVDLDTVKPGLVHYDIGDCIRSGCNPLGEEIEHWEAVRFEPDICRAILQGYISMAKSFLTENDYEYLYDAMRLIAFELGLRYFTDYLEGNVYFKARHREHNLLRALVQFRLAEDMELEESSILNIIRDMRR